MNSQLKNNDPEDKAMWKKQERKKITKMLSANYLVVAPPKSKRMTKRQTQNSLENYGDTIPEAKKYNGGNSDGINLDGKITINNSIPKDSHLNDFSGSIISIDS